MADEELENYLEREDRWSRDRYERSEEIEQLESNLAAVTESLKLFLDRMDRFGSWEDGCFYYNRVSATELQEPIVKARAALALVRGGK